MDETTHLGTSVRTSAAFRYFHGVNREFKDWGALLKMPPTIQWRTLMEYLGNRTAAGDIVTTANWLNKATYKGNGGPYLNPGQSTLFRHFQIRLLLERHRLRRAWGPDIDIVLDRWGMSQAQRLNLEDYIKNNWHLQPVGQVTTVNSVYVDGVQVVDLLARLARRVAEGKADAVQAGWAAKLFNLHEVQQGLYAPKK